jgi:prepilin-type N-terminal cleavage/methylation domain-containing protein
MLSKKIKKGSGFTLIELLIVIAIIGILAAIFVGPVGDILARARDTRRIADVRQLAMTLEKEVAMGNTAALAGCTVANATTTLCTGTGVPPLGATTTIGVQFPIIRDPGAGPGVAACGPAVATICHYSISREGGAAGARTIDYRICFFLETDPDAAGPLAAGLNRIVTGTRFISGCPAP